jgi:homopolymeric O-antigen transport system permease protein
MHIPNALPGVVRSTSVRPGLIRLVLDGYREVLSRRRLIRYLVQADLKKKGSDTALGNVWWVLDPLLQMIVYVILVSVIFARSQPDYPLFIFAAILPWKWFSTSVSDGIGSVVSQERLIKQIQFPKLVLPTSATFAGIVNFAFGMIPLGLLLVLLFRDRITPNLVFIPIIAIVQLAFTLAITVVLAALNVFVRDIGNIARHALRLWFYLSPGLYGIDQLESSATLKDHPQVLAVLESNPFATLFDAYRAVVYGTPTGGPLLPNWSALAMLFLVSLLLLTVSIAVFKRLEPQFAKVL